MNASAPFLPGAGRVHSRLALCAVLALTIVLAAVGPSEADASSPLDFSAGDQYVETLPTSKGPKVTENAPERKRAGSGLSKRVQKQLATAGGGDAGTLAYVADAPELGAPVAAGSSQGTSGGDGSKKASKKRGAGNESPNVPSAAVNAAGESGNDILWLALALPVITAVALGAFGLQRRNRDAG